MANFADIENHWATSCILELARRNLMIGYPDRRFQPDSPISRAELAALLFRMFVARIFTGVPIVRQPVGFRDIPAQHWAYPAITWAYQHAFFSGYPDQTFRPDQPLPRAQAIALLAKAKGLAFPAIADVILQQSFDDALEIPDYAKGALAAATLNNLVVNYPDVRQLRPMNAATRAEVAALCCQSLSIFHTLSQYVPWSLSLRDIKDGVTVPVATLESNPPLVKHLQIRLSHLRLYPRGGRWLDGRYNEPLAAALHEFARLKGLSSWSSGKIDQPFAEALLQADASDLLLERARDRAQVFAEFLNQEVGADATQLAFLDRGKQNSPYPTDITPFPDRLCYLPDDIEVTALGTTVPLGGTNETICFKPYPKLGQCPQIDLLGLSFLHNDIQCACICVGTLVEGTLYAHWLGRDALKNIELWGTSQIIPLLQVVAKLNAQSPQSEIEHCLVRPQGSQVGYAFGDLALDLVSYRRALASSHAAAALFKQFDTPVNLENWLKDLTGNHDLWFRGYYGEPPLIQVPELVDRQTQEVVLAAPITSHTAGNRLSTYDLTRVISMLGWHHYLPSESRIPHAKWDSLSCLVRALGTDSARYIDVAIDRLGLDQIIKSPVILSKLGFGRSSIRDRTELVYTALVQFIDRRPRAQGKPAILRQIAMTLMSAKDYNDANYEAREQDARMATEVTEILRRLVTQELV